VTLETLFEKFDQFADAPDAVAKMRELVLNFAVTGRLSHQEAGDASVCELVDSLATAKARLSKKRVGTSESVTQRPIKVPAHWAWLPLNDIGAMSGGMTPSKAKSAFWDGDVNWFSSKDIKTDELTESELKITREAADKTGLQVYPPGCLIIVARSGILKRTLPVGVLRAPGTVNQDLKVLSPFVGGLERYLQMMLRGMTDFILAKLVKTGMTVQSLKYDEFEVQPFPLPPLAEQKRIVAKVDELMALCDRLEEQQQERESRHAVLARAALARFADAPTPANLQFLFHPSYAIPPADLRKSVLTLAVQGKLVPQDPNDEPAGELLARSDARRREIARSDHRADEENQPLLSADDRWEIADTWSWRGLADLVLFVDYRGKTPAKLSSGVRLLTAKNVRKGRISLTPEEFLSESEYHSWMTRGFPQAGDVLFTTEAPMGNVAVVQSTERFALAQRVICFQSYGALDPDFMVTQILCDQFQFVLDKNGTGVTAKGIKASKLKQLPVAVPPIAEQRRIVAKVDELMAMVDQLEAQLAASRVAAANLLAAAVAELTGAGQPV
jgi:type I restriction enzyme S subunit